MPYPRISQDAGRNLAVFIALVFCGPRLAFGYREQGYQYLSPVPQSEYVLPQTRFILVRFETVSPYSLTNLSTFITVTGASSGTHSGLTKIASDDKTVIFDMSSDFSSNELVTVSMAPAFDGATVEPYEYQFMVSKPMPGSLLAPAEASSKSLSIDSIPEPTTAVEPMPTATPPTKGLAGAMIMPNGVSVPSDFPDITITANDNPAPGYIYIDYSGSPKYTMMLDSSGSPVWYQRGTAHRDFKLQKNGIITWTTFQGFDQNFSRLASPADSYHAVNGYSTDNHELQVLENGHYLLFGRRNETVDMRRYVAGGRSAATVRETVLQEFTPEGDLIFQWRAWDNYDIRLMEYWSYDDKPTSSSIRFVHMNAVDVDTDGHLLVSSKRVSEVTKINRDTGEIIWRLGGGNPVNPNDDPYLQERLTILNDPLPTGQFNVQHDIRVVGENRYTVFDNHHLDSTPNSRAVEYEVDPNEMTATMVWQYQGGYDSYHMGNAQRLPNGNTLINWVITNAPKVTEVRPDGTKAFEMNWSAQNSKSYRVFKFPWDGVVETPNLIIEPQPDSLMLIFNKFGDPNVAYYRIYGGTSPQPTTLLDTSTSTLKHLTDFENGSRYYFRVKAVDIHGMESVYSNEVSVDVNIIQPGQNMVSNGDFSQGKDSWIWEVGGSASAAWIIEDGVSHFDITGGGTQISDVQLRQAGMKLTQG
ncbi:MAG: aryl-sulfate sulfotransferase, partial [Dehalococcoidales bacterium]